MAVELWWIVPVTTGAGVMAVAGIRHQRAADARRLEYDAARLELHDARARLWSVRSAEKIVRAELARSQADRQAARATSADVAAARRRVAAVQRDLRAAAADVRVRRMRVSAARAGLSVMTDPADQPLARTMARHDDIVQRWLAYETDAARRIVFPGMSDGHVPETAAYLTARVEAQRLRPPAPQARITPIQYVAYRNAVDELARTFELAEERAWREARAAGMVEPEPRTDPGASWAAAAQTLIERSNVVLTRVGEGAAAVAAMAARMNEATATRPAKEQSPQPAPKPTPERGPAAHVWPVPSRTSHRPAS